MNQIIKNNPYKTYIALWGIGLTFVFFVASTIQSWSKFLEIFEVDKLHFFLSLTLAIVCFILLIIYSIETYKELNLLNDFLDGKRASRVQSKTYLTVIAIAIFFGALISITHMIIVFSIVIVFYNLFDIWGGWQVDKNIRPLIESKLKEKNEQEVENIVIAIKNFYFKNPTMQRDITIMFVNWIAISFSIVFYFTSENMYRNIAYTIIITNIIIGEIIIYYWRRKRDKIIYKNESILKEK